MLRCTLSFLEKQLKVRAFFGNSDLVATGARKASNVLNRTGIIHQNIQRNTHSNLTIGLNTTDDVLACLADRVSAACQTKEEDVDSALAAIAAISEV